jgi:tetratricopeptide (TPR) repeat protein
VDVDQLFPEVRRYICSASQAELMSDTLTQARDLLDDQHFAEALELLHTVSPVTSTVKVSVARALSGLGRWEEAHSLFCEVLGEDPDCHEGFAGRGLLYFLSGDMKKAHGDYQKAIDGAPMNGRYHGLQGILMAEVGDAPKAMKDLESAYDLGCHDSAFLLARAQIYLAVRDLDKARSSLDLAEKHGGDEAAIAALEGALSMLKGEPKEALASYRFSVEKAPEAPNNWLNMLTLTANLERSLLLEESVKALEAHPNHGEIIQLAVGAHLEAGKVKEAFQILKDAIKRNPKSPLLYFQMGMGLAQIGKFDKAVEQLSKALELAPRFPRALDARGNCLEQLGRKEEAQVDFEKSRDIRAEDAEKRAVQQNMVPPSQNGSLQAADEVGPSQ